VQLAAKPIVLRSVKNFASAAVKVHMADFGASEFSGGWRRETSWYSSCRLGRSGSHARESLRLFL